MKKKMQRSLIEEERLILDATELVCELMEAEGVNQTELARRLQVSKPSISQMLSGDNNLTLRSMANIAAALGYQLHFAAQKKDKA